MKKEGRRGRRGGERSEVFEERSLNDTLVNRIHELPSVLEPLEVLLNGDVLDNENLSRRAGTRESKIQKGKEGKGRTRGGISRGKGRLRRAGLLNHLVVPLIAG